MDRTNLESRNRLWNFDAFPDDLKLREYPQLNYQSTRKGKTMENKNITKRLIELLEQSLAQWKLHIEENEQMDITDVNHIEAQEWKKINFEMKTMKANLDNHNHSQFAAIAAGENNEHKDKIEELLRSACAIAERRGKNTNWSGFVESIKKVGLNGITARTYRVVSTEKKGKLQ